MTSPERLRAAAIAAGDVVICAVCRSSTASGNTATFPRTARTATAALAEEGHPPNRVGPAHRAPDRPRPAGCPRTAVGGVGATR
jgi:hypothetical protein